jgi:hypothetical protein
MNDVCFNYNLSLGTREVSVSDKRGRRPQRKCRNIEIPDPARDSDCRTRWQHGNLQGPRGDVATVLRGHLTPPTWRQTDGRTGRSFGATPTLNSTLLQRSGLWRAPTGAVLLLSSLSRRAVGGSCCLHSSSAWPQPTTSPVKKNIFHHFSKDTSTMLNLFYLIYISVV